MVFVTIILCVCGRERERGRGERELVGYMASLVDRSVSAPFSYG